MTTTNIITAIFDALLGGLTEVVSAIPTAIKSVFENLFFTTAGSGDSAVTSLSVFANVCLIFGGIALALGITKLVYHLVASKIGA